MVFTCAAALVFTAYDNRAVLASNIQALTQVLIGGTGRSTLASGSVLYGLGTSPVGLAANPSDATQALCGTNPPAFALTCAGAGGGSIAHTTNVLIGDGSGNAVSGGFAATGAGIVTLFSGCSGVFYLGADAACHTAAPVRTFGYAFGATDAGSALVAGGVGYFTLPFACTIQAWNISVDAGTVTFDIWKIATGSANPTVANTIVASAAPALSSGTAVHSTTLTGWTTSVVLNDIVGIDLKTVATAKFASLGVQCQ